MTVLPHCSQIVNSGTTLPPSSMAWPKMSAMRTRALPSWQLPVDDYAPTGARSTIATIENSVARRHEPCHSFDLGTKLKVHGVKPAKLPCLLKVLERSRGSSRYRMETTETDGNRRRSLRHLHQPARAALPCGVGLRHLLRTRCVGAGERNSRPGK
jgi:hypothetical protein